MPLVRLSRHVAERKKPRQRPRLVKEGNLASLPTAARNATVEPPGPSPTAVVFSSGSGVKLARGLNIEFNFGFAALDVDDKISVGNIVTDLARMLRIACISREDQPDHTHHLHFCYIDFSKVK